MYLFILESIGTSELILIGIIALIFLGPRKLPQIAKTIGKTMADFRNTTNEFKETWQREVDFEEEIGAIRTGEINDSGPTPVPRLDPHRDVANTVALPEIKPAATDSFTDSAKLPEPPQEKEEEPAEADVSDKRSWL